VTADNHTGHSWEMPEFPSDGGKMADMISVQISTGGIGSHGDRSAGGGGALSGIGQTADAINPPMTAPTIPNAVVISDPLVCRPGTISRANAPMSSPIRIQLISAIALASLRARVRGTDHPTEWSAIRPSEPVRRPTM
jgi:hypothetical protein